jgi:hypothetical protein
MCPDVILSKARTRAISKKTLKTFENYLLRKASLLRWRDFEKLCYLRSYRKRSHGISGKNAPIQAETPRVGV